MLEFVGRFAVRECLRSVFFRYGSLYDVLIRGLGFFEIGGLMVAQLSRRVVPFRLSLGVAGASLGRGIAILRPNHRLARDIGRLNADDAFARRLLRKLILEFFAIGWHGYTAPNLRLRSWKLRSALKNS